MPDVVNIAARLQESARRSPDQPAVVAPRTRNRDGSYRYDVWTFRELDEISDRLAAGLTDMGIRPGARLVLFVPFSREFVALTFALFKAGAVIVLIDPGMGKTNIFNCLEEVQPDGFVAVPLVHVVRLLKRPLFPGARHLVTVGRRWFWGGRTYRQLLKTRTRFPLNPTKSTDPAAVIYTSGSTGPPKGVLYEHGMFDAQVDMIRDFYGIEAGEIDLPGFPLFGLFNAAMGVTTVIPDMDPTRPAAVNPEHILQHVHDWSPTQAFGSPAFWNRVGRHCEANGITLPSLKRALSAGGPVPSHVLHRVGKALTGAGAQLHTPYGATECLPVASIGSSEVLQETAERTRQGAGTCVGRPFPGVDVRIIPMTDGPIPKRDDVAELPSPEIGEIVVRSRAATREYDRRPEATGLAKILDDEAASSNMNADAFDARPTVWHRMGDVGYLDGEGRLWFCGRKAHVVETLNGRMFSVCCEAIFNDHPRIYRSALVGLGTKPPQTPLIVVEAEADAAPKSPADEEQLRQELLTLGRANPLTAMIDRVLFHPSLPVDTRHNVKIDREALAVWAAKQLR
ncbi:MAG: AMP-binding protein [Planctomycetaceae bacterium]|nr:AMP-binding protein [Planctomycetaceae bacterium]